MKIIVLVKVLDGATWNDMREVALCVVLELMRLPAPIATSLKGAAAAKNNCCAFLFILARGARTPPDEELEVERLDLWFLFLAFFLSITEASLDSMEASCLRRPVLLPREALDVFLLRTCYTSGV